MEKEFVPYQQALSLKELGFNQPCFAVYENKKWFLVESKNSMSYELCLKTDTFPVPTRSQAFRWFREKYQLFGCIDLHVSTHIHWYIRIDDIIKNDYLFHSEDTDLKFNTHEEAELACLEKLIEIVKDK